MNEDSLDCLLLIKLTRAPKKKSQSISYILALTRFWRIPFLSCVTIFSFCTSTYSARLCALLTNDFGVVKNQSTSAQLWQPLSTPHCVSSSKYVASKLFACKDFFCLSKWAPETQPTYQVQLQTVTLTLQLEKWEQSTTSSMLFYVKQSTMGSASSAPADHVLYFLILLCTLSNHMASISHSSL